MNFQFYTEKLKNSPEYKNFIEKNPEAFLCSVFFILDKQGTDNKQHIDYFIPSDNKMFSFQLEDGVKLIPLEQINNKIPEKISDDIDFNFEYIEKLILGEMFEKKINNQIQKIIGSLQRLNDKDFLIGSVFISEMGIISLKIDLSEMKIIEFEKRSFFDFIKRVK
jgi:hypothetical protein